MSLIINSSRTTEFEISIAAAHPELPGPSPAPVPQGRRSRRSPGQGPAHPAQLLVAPVALVAPGVAVWLGTGFGGHPQKDVPSSPQPAL